jgi:hypothetical protein
MQIKIVGPLFPEKYLDESGVEQTRGFYSFLVDGVPSLKWYPECRVPGYPVDYYVRRCINRLEAGRSAEAFGTAPTVVIDGQPVTAAATDPNYSSVLSQLQAAGVPSDLAEQAVAVLRRGSKSGRGSIREVQPTGNGVAIIQGGRLKHRPAKSAYSYTLDGVESEESYPTADAARRVCAIRAFMSRHKLGQVPAAQAALEAQFPGRACKVWACAEEHGICATVDGERYSIGWQNVAGTWTVEKFKKIGE